MAASVAGEVLGPRPGRAICSFWQGGMETVLRIIAPLVGSLPALVAAAVALGYIAEDDQLRAFQMALSSSNSSNPVANLVDPNTYGSAGFVIGIAALAIIVELLFIIVRICNVGLINLKVKIFLIIDFIFSVFFVVGHLAGGVVTAVYAADWADTTFDRITISMAVASAFCFIAMFLFGFLGVWSLIFMMKEWNDKVVKYTIKEAITG